MNNTALVPTQLNGLPSLAEAEVYVRRLIDRGAVAASDLDEARCQAEAYALYEQRAQHHDRACHYMRLKVLAEAALGALSLDDPDVELGLMPGPGRRGPILGRFRALAAAFERGQLQAMCDAVEEAGKVPSSAAVAAKVRKAGLMWVPREALGDLSALPHRSPREYSEVLPWCAARVAARANGISLESLPPDPFVLQRAAARRKRADARRAEQAAAARALSEQRRKQELRRCLKDASAAVAEAYSLLSKLEAPLGQATRDLSMPGAWRDFENLRSKVVEALGATRDMAA